MTAEVLEAAGPSEPRGELDECRRNHAKGRAGLASDQPRVVAHRAFGDRQLGAPRLRQELCTDQSAVTSQIARTNKTLGQQLEGAVCVSHSKPEHAIDQRSPHAPPETRSCARSNRTASGSSDRSNCPSPSVRKTYSIRARQSPDRTAAPYPRLRQCCTTSSSGIAGLRSARIRAVSSVLPSSMTMISSSEATLRPTSAARRTTRTTFPSSLKQGTTTERRIGGEPNATGETLAREIVRGYVRHTDPKTLGFSQSWSRTSA
jgi:hypothetical protein